MATIDRPIFFESVRQSLFYGKLDQGQVDGMEDIIAAFEEDYNFWDLRWLAYALATTLHETSATMQPIEEYGKGEGSDYGEPDPETGECYYGRGFVQLTWASNYQKADKELGFEGNDSCYLHPERQLEADVAAPTMFQGMSLGWFRTADDGTKETLSKYFNDTRDDPYGAREIINGDKTYTPDWAGGTSIGNLIAGYHKKFLSALQDAYVEDRLPEPAPEPEAKAWVSMAIVTSEGTQVIVLVNDKEVFNGQT